ncbi:MAG: tRNA pseudouridine(38-40) synthase TruA [Desulforhopalus sp.]
MSPDHRNIKLVIAYDGTDFSGWQRQRHDRTIQGEIERCLSQMTREQINLHGAGRTDRGVHARGMVANFTTGSAISSKDILQGLNSMLPGAIRIYSAQDIDPDFHARFSAISKQYQYTIHTGKVQPPHLRLYSVHVTYKMDLPAIRNCLEMLEGTHDFSSFENSGSRDKSDCSGRGAVRTISRSELIEIPPDQLIFNFAGDGFLRNMVRNFMGSLLEVGRGKLSPENFSEILNAKDRTMAGPTAPAHGLFLVEVFYQ